jgi:hypothetical protein
MHRVPQCPGSPTNSFVWGGVPRDVGPAFSFQAHAPVERKLIHPRYGFYRSGLQPSVSIAA